MFKRLPFFEGEVDKVNCKYGNFITEQLSHYGDCTDVALRCASIQHEEFRCNKDALGTKRRPILERANIVSSQLIAAQRYYKNRLEEARKRLEYSARDNRFVDDANRRAHHLCMAPYSPQEDDAPQAKSKHDREWGSVCEAGGEPKAD